MLFISIVVFAAAMAMMLTVYHLATADRRTINIRLQNYVVRNEATAPPVAQALAGKDQAGWRVALQRMGTYVESPYWTRMLEHKLVQSGLPLKSSEFLVICIGISLFVGLFTGIISGWNLFIGGIASIASFGLAVAVLNLKISERRKKFNEQLGDTLILVANSLRTGYSFLQAIEMVSREMPKPISEEFARLLKEMNLGVPSEEALNNLAKRINSDDMDLVVTAVLIQRQVGGNLAEVLDSIAGTIRERVKLKRQIRTLTAQGRISGLIIGILPVGMAAIIYCINPQYIQMLVDHPMGRLMLTAGVASQIMGVVFIRRIVNISI